MPVHLKVDTGLNRFGVRWKEVGRVVEEMRGLAGLVLEGVMSHFAMSDEVEKTFALEQVQRFERAVEEVRERGPLRLQRHVCNSGGFLDMPGAWFDGVRLGLLPLGIYPSEVCGRMEGLLPVMSVKARVVTVRELGVGESYGYGLRFRALERRRIAILPVGYGDGYPRLVNQGEVLVRGRRAPVVGSVAMDAMGVDVTGVPGVEVGEEVVLMGEQGTEAITARELARWGGTVCYDVLAGWRGRLPRVET
jgi:alanine racemase